MKRNSEVFLTSFNRIEKWMRRQLDNPANIGFSELVRRLSRRKDLLIQEHGDDLIQLAQLRNAIVHDKIAPDFIIAEPNDWAVKKIIQIEEDLINPEKVIPVFQKNVTGFEQSTLLSDLLKIVASKGYSQFPIYRRGKFLGLITAHGLGIWLARHTKDNYLDIEGKTAFDVLDSDRRSQNFRFVAAATPVFEAVELFLNSPYIEALLITKDGHPDGNLLGIIRPRDVFKNYYGE